MQTMPMQTMPMQTMPMQTMPMRTMPMQTMPMQTMPLRPVPTGEPPLAPPMQSSSLGQDGSITTVAAKKAVMPLKKQVEDRVGNAEDYSWITGQLFYVHVGGGKWVLRYTSVDQVDRYGGSVVLAPVMDMKNYREGDLVCVHGEVMQQQRALPPLGGALYRVNAINLLERADPGTH
jgi:hypothetical protein